MIAAPSTSGSGYENKGSTGLQNNGNYLPSATMLHPWRNKSLATPLCETQILQTFSSYKFNIHGSAHRSMTQDK
jgi:hypothetical protein